MAVAVWLDDGRPLLFRQIRVGRMGKPFWVLKFRSMFNRREGALFTTSVDRRVTRVGRFLRRCKLDELPQLWNVVRGDMSLIGPRPEVPQYVDMNDPAWREVLRVKPGITDLATIMYHDEEWILSGFGDPERDYRERLLPAKLALNVEYLHKRSFFRDLKLLALTLRYTLLPGRVDPVKVKKLILARDN